MDIVRRTQVSHDPDSHLTRCHIEAEGRGELALLARYVDPLGWSTHGAQVWKASYKVVTGPAGSFIKDPDQPSCGHSWTGILYESVDWRCNGIPLSSVDNYLNIRFQTRETELALDYSLHHCVGGKLLAGISRCRMDIDRGYFRARLQPSGLVFIEALKCIRFTDGLSRQTRSQGESGAGQVLNRCTPLVLQSWMDSVMTASLRQWARASQQGGSDARLK